MPSQPDRVVNRHGLCRICQNHAHAAPYELQGRKDRDRTYGELQVLDSASSRRHGGIAHASDASRTLTAN